MRRLFAMLAKIAARDVTVLVTGESGTGKELIARALHDASGRSAGPFVVIDGGAMPAGLMESEMGHPDVAERLLQRAVSIMPDHPLPHWFLGQALFRKGNGKTAALEIHKAMLLRRGH